MRLKDVQVEYTVWINSKGYPMTMVKTVDVNNPDDEILNRAEFDASLVFRQFDSIEINSAWYKSGTAEIIMIPC